MSWVDTCVARAHRAWRSAVSLAYLTWVMLRSWMRCTFCTASPREHGPTAYRVYLFNEGPGEGFYRTVPPRYFNPETWEDDVRALTGWVRFRAEVRYVFRHKKYRMVLHPGDACVFPPYEEPAAPACRLPKGVLSARLQGPPGSGIDTDVTHRIMKYQGPRGNFHADLGLHVRMHDMFPFDDQDDNRERFTHLRIIDTMARMCDLPYALNPRVTMDPAAPKE